MVHKSEINLYEVYIAINYSIFDKFRILDYDISVKIFFHRMKARSR